MIRHAFQPSLVVARTTRVMQLMTAVRLVRPTKIVVTANFIAAPFFLFHHARCAPGRPDLCENDLALREIKGFPLNRRGPILDS